ncbi:MAG: molybdopterin dinucleotide-binding protein [Candidatus Bathyarchaeota archaeon]|jgi:formylmethanofuran dehydrogenase subunit D|nr:MAG: molybdopterin dinucleotide-binding protein [Candidatus Bathyarchaeota archaeon]
MQKIRVTLVTGRTIDQGATKEHGKLSDDYLNNVAVCELDPEDLSRVGIKEGSTIRVSTGHGKVVVKARKSRRTPHVGIAYMPYGLWVNQIINSQTHGTGMPSFKGIQAEIEAAPEEKVLNILQLLKKNYREKRR